MRFKIKKTEVSFSFSFFALFVLFTAIGNTRILYISFITSIIHETIHLLFIFITGAGVESVTFSFFGGNIRRSVTPLSDYKEALISLSAPIFNIAIGILLLINNNESLWGQVNLLTGLFNVTPFYNFDGGRGIYYLLRSKVKSNTLKSITILISCFILFIFTFINFYLITADKINITLCFICIFMFASLIFNYIKDR